MRYISVMVVYWCEWDLFAAIISSLMTGENGNLFQKMALLE